MLKNVPKIISPNLLKVICEMGHSDEIVIADGNFPSESIGKNAIVIRLDGHRVSDVLSAIIKYFPLDQYVDQPVGLMKTLDNSVPVIWKEYEEILKSEPTENYSKGFEEIERFEFYERAKNAYAIIATGEKALYANIIIKKGTC